MDSPFPPKQKHRSGCFGVFVLSRQNAALSLNPVHKGIDLGESLIVEAAQALTQSRVRRIRIAQRREELIDGHAEVINDVKQAGQGRQSAF